MVFDIVRRSAPALSVDERMEVTKVARDLLARLKVVLLLHWQQNVTARWRLKLAIEDAQDAGQLRASAPELYPQKCSTVFQHA